MTGGDSMAVGDGIRASDRDRERIIEVLTEQTSQGRLTLVEFEERTRRVYEARTWDELRALVEDLPVRISFAAEAPLPATSATSVTRPGAMAGWRSASWLWPALCCVLLAGAVVALAFGASFGVLFPCLIVARFARRGHFRTMRRHGRYRH
ncbi:MAG TPA: DUF1707 domain-containing protein [Mycobacteriales bacterium]|nr:DUF1707 domain-containing protein [Mycobacteriales bacterium]